MLWESITCVCRLTSQNRGKADREWFDALRRLREMESEDADIAMFNTRFQQKEDWSELPPNALYIAYRNEDVDEANRTCLLRQGNSIVEITASHNVRPTRGHDGEHINAVAVQRLLQTAQEPSHSRDQQIPPSTGLAIGAPVVLTMNLAQAAGLCNGTRGVVYDFMFKPGSSIPIVLVRITDKYRGPSFLPQTPAVVPIIPRTISWGTKTQQLRTYRTGLPLRLGYAMTTHKVQGLTCEFLVFDPSNLPTSAFAYVGLSRVKERHNLVLTHLISLKATQQQKRASEILHAETQRVFDRSCETTEKNRELIRRMKYLAVTENQANFARE